MTTDARPRAGSPTWSTRQRWWTGRTWSTWIAFTGLVLWGLLHIAGGLSLLPVDVADGLETLGPSVSDTVPTEPGRAAEALLRFHSLNVLLGGIAVFGLAVAWWRLRVRWQLDAALAVAIGLDLGLVIFMVVPGVLPPSQGLIGPALVLFALIGALPARRQPALG